MRMSGALSAICRFVFNETPLFNCRRQKARETSAKGCFAVGSLMANRQSLMTLVTHDYQKMIIKK
jgi:hypothetical protein